MVPLLNTFQKMFYVAVIIYAWFIFTVNVDGKDKRTGNGREEGSEGCQAL